MVLVLMVPPELQEGPVFLVAVAVVQVVVYLLLLWGLQELVAARVVPQVLAVVMPEVETLQLDMVKVEVEVQEAAQEAVKPQLEALVAMVVRA
jgi:hypothetical protein